MKKILLAIAIFSLALSAQAQNRDVLLNNIKKAEEATTNPKKSGNPITWIKYGDAFLTAHTAMYGSLWVGASKNEAMLLLDGSQAVNAEMKTINGVQYELYHFVNNDFYFNQNGFLDAVVITNPVIKEPHVLVSAREAYLKAAELDVKHSKYKAIAEKLSSVHDNLVTEGFAYYFLNDIANAAKCFEESLSCYDNPVVNNQDSLITYYAAVTNAAVGNNAKAKEYYTKCLEMGYYVQGDAAAELSAILIAEGETDLAKQYLGEAFAKYPASQSVLVTLINLYIDTNEDPGKILELIKGAQANEPGNASLVYAEGNVYLGLKDIDKAIECFNRSYEVDKNYLFGIYSIGNVYFDAAIAIQTEMNELAYDEYKKYDELSAKFDEKLLLAIDPFEKVFNETQNAELKSAVANNLKQIYYRFRTRDAKYEDGYKKYEAFLAQ